MVLALAFAAPLAAQKPAQQKQPAASGPASPEELARQAEQKAAAGDVEGALELLRKAAAMPAATGDVSLKLGRLLESRLELDAAIAAFQAAADKLSGPQKGEALGRMSVAQEVRGMAQSAQSADAALQADPAGAWPLVAAARARARQGKGDEAVAMVEKAQAAGSAAQAALGYAQEARSDLGAAEAAYRTALAAEPGGAIATVGLARVLRKTKRGAEAEPLLTALTAKMPGAVEAYKELARTKLALGRPDDAVSDAAIAAAMSEGDLDAQRLNLEVTVAKSMALVASGQGDLAIQDLQAARDKNPDAGFVRLGLAKALIARRQADLALVELKKAVELEPQNAEAQHQLGYVNHVMKGNAAAAVGPYEKAVAADGANAEYRTSLGAALNGTKQYDRAVEELQKVIQTPGYSKADAWIYLGEAQLQLKRYKEAVTTLEKGAELAPQNVQAAAYLAWAYFGLKDAANFKKHGARARTLGYKEPTLLDYLTKIEGGQAIK
jgi:tetratricopeptide (TPR) repeat protein